MARRIRPLLTHVGSLLDPRPPIRSLFGAVEPEAASDDDGDGGEVEP